MKTELGARIPQLHCAIGVCPCVRVHAMCARTYEECSGIIQQSSTGVPAPVRRKVLYP